MLEELNIKTKMVDGEKFISTADLSTHLRGSTVSMIVEALPKLMTGEFSSEEALYIKGVLDGLDAIIMLITSEDQLDKMLNKLLG